MLLPALYGIIGSPLGHSLSPLLHNTGFNALDFPGIYLPWEVRPDQLADFMKAVPILNIRGCSVTLPHKVSCIPFLDRITERVTLMGACNTIYRDGDALCGDNTDVLGFMSPLRNAGLSATTRALLLGAGGAARATAVGLRQLGVTNLFLTNRNPVRGQEAAADLSATFLPWEERRLCRADIVVNTTSLGMTGALEDLSPYPNDGFQGRGIAYDVVYTPLQTRFLREAAASGWDTISGLDMFLGQGDAQFRLWTGQHLPLKAIQAVRETLYSHQHPKEPS